MLRHHHHHRGMSMPANIYYSWRPIRRVPIQRDQFFHLPTVIAQNDPFLRGVYSIVTFVLDDHPYPATREDFIRRSYEINENLRVLNLSPMQDKFLRRLMTETGVTLVDLWQGSHIVVLDNGALYDAWSKSASSNARFSSHYRQIPVQQYGINFKDHQLLFGKTSADGSTWFQMEAHGFDPSDIYNDPDLAVIHGQDFIKYRFHGMNVGPFGFSPHTETSNPIVLPYKPFMTKRMRRRR